jgi:eukaryotic-like serine/threonine-protein kinase
VIASLLDEAEIFNAARRIGDRGARSLYLREVCGGNEVLIRRVEALLAVNDAPDRLLDQAAIQTPAGGDTQTGQASASANPLGFLNPSDQPGSLGRLGHYDIREVIGRGGMGIVLKAFDQKLHRVVAIKVMAPYLAVSTTAGKRFVREARSAAAIRNEHVIDLHAVEEENGLPYFVMEYVAGMSLQERLDRTGPVQLTEVLRIGMQTARGLAAAHAVGMIHRDVKPANILLENGVERVKLTDFGLARAVDDASLTVAGMIAGTPMYMSPEQARGESADPRSDLFSLGSVLYTLCTGRPPFVADTSLAVLKRICEETPRDPRETDPTIPAWLVTIISRLHAKDPADRFQSAAEVADLLAQHLVALKQTGALLHVPITGVPSSARVRRFRTGHAGLVALALGLAVIIPLCGPAIYRFATNKGEIVIETDDPDTSVTVKQDGEVVQIVDKKSGRTVTLKAGRYQLELSEGANGLTLSTDQFTLERGGKVIVKVELATPAITEVHRFKGLTDIPWAAGFCSDGRVISGGGGVVRDGQFAPGSDFTLRVWDAKSGRELKRLDGHREALLCLAVSPDGKTAISGGNESDKEGFTIRVWDLQTYKELRHFSKHTGRIVRATFLPNGRHVVSVGGPAGNGKRGEIRLWDAETGEEVRQFKGHQHEVKGVAVTSDGKHMITSGSDNLTLFWDIESGTEIRSRRMTGIKESGGCVSIARDGGLAALACWDGSILVFEVASGNRVCRLTGHKDGTGSLAITPDGRRVLSSGGDKTIRLWDVESEKEVCRMDDFQDSTGVGAISADGKEAIVFALGNTLRLVRLPPVTPAKKK